MTDSEWRGAVHAPGSDLPHISPRHSDPAADRTPVRLTRTAASTAVESLGWRYLLGTLCLSLPVASLDQALGIAAAATTSTGAAADGHLRIDLRPDRAELSLQTRAQNAVTDVDVDLARAISTAVRPSAPEASVVSTADVPRPVQMLEIAIDATDIPSIRPFWRAVLAYEGEPGLDGPDDAIIDPAGQLPAIWFQQMDSPRPQRNRIHLDITVAHDEAEARVRAALAAGGILVDDSYARSFWVLADVEGNEVCVCTWTDRDERDAARAP